MTPVEENVPRTPFSPRRRRALLSFRRKRDLVWFLATTLSFVVSVTILSCGVKLRKPVVVERVVEKVVASSEDGGR
jgi:hypothetical protein